MKKTIIILSLLVISFSSMVNAMDYTWAENNRWTWMASAPAPLLLNTGDTLSIVPDAGGGEKWLADSITLTNHGTINWQDTKTL